MKKTIVVFAALLVLVVSVGSKKANKQITLFTIGDSTMANKPERGYPETGWGQVLPLFFDTTKVVVQNHAVNGRSSKSFIGEGRWAKVYEQIKPGDYVFIQFGHNDQKDQSPDRYTNPYTEYRRNLQMYVEKTREKGGIPVLFTSIARRNFNEKGTLIDTHGAYPEVVRSVAAQMNVVLIDLQIISELLILEKGLDGSKAMFLHTKPGEYEGYPNGKEDNTHLNRKGAMLIASNVVDELKLKVKPLAKFLNK